MEEEIIKEQEVLFEKLMNKSIPYPVEYNIYNYAKLKSIPYNNSILLIGKADQLTIMFQSMLELGKQKRVYSIIEIGKEKLKDLKKIEDNELVGYNGRKKLYVGDELIKKLIYICNSHGIKSTV